MWRVINKDIINVIAYFNYIHLFVKHYLKLFIKASLLCEILLK